jgi:hypothetical protein
MDDKRSIRVTAAVVEIGPKHRKPSVYASARRQAAPQIGYGNMDTRHTIISGRPHFVNQPDKHSLALSGAGWKTCNLRLAPPSRQG